MKTLNNYINETWSGVKQQSLKQEIESWCEEMGIRNYTINSKGEIDVDGNVDLRYKKIKELPYKFGTIKGYFSLRQCENLISLKNCPNETGGYFDVDYCFNLDSLEGCPKKVRGTFFCRDCKGRFTKEDVQSLCKAKHIIYI